MKEYTMELVNKETGETIMTDIISIKTPIEKINEAIEKLGEGNKGEVSDGSHTFDELYFHRMTLFAVICNHNKDISWKSWKHHDGTMFDNYFIVGINTPDGQYSYHYHEDHWNLFNVKELAFAPEWDGHKPEDIHRLFSIKNTIELTDTVICKEEFTICSDLDTNEKYTFKTNENYTIVGDIGNYFLVQAPRCAAVRVNKDLVREKFKKLTFV